MNKGAGMGAKRSQGFTLIELLIVIVIISLLAALLLPALMKALCNARSGAASSLISQLAQAAKTYELDSAVYPPGKGTDSKDLAYYLERKGAKQLPYFEFQPDQKVSGGNIMNPVWGADGEPPTNMIYYRNNAVNRPRGGGAPPPAPAGQCPIIHPSSFDIWAAGCDYTSGVPATGWSVKFE